MKYSCSISLALLLAALCLLPACRKDPMAPLSAFVECAPLPTGPSNGWDYMWDRHFIQHPSFNPEDPDLILFTHAPYAGDLRQVCVLRLSTGERTVAFEGSVMLRCHWLDGNRIVVNTDQGVCMVDKTDNGLTCITGPGRFAYVVERQQARIVCSDGLGNLIVMDAEGTALETFVPGCSSQGQAVWMQDGNFVELYCYGLRAVNPWACTNELLAPLPQGAHSCGTGLAELPGNAVLWAEKTGLYRTDLASKQTVLLRNSCNRNYLAGLSYDPVGRRILSALVHFEPDGSTLMRISSKLVLLDEEGATIQEIGLDW